VIFVVSNIFGKMNISQKILSFEDVVIDVELSKIKKALVLADWLWVERNAFHFFPQKALD
jgi:hypothetical protein